MKKPAWSHSALKDFESCARKYHEVRVLKRYPFEKDEKQLYGEEVHKAAELYVKDGTPIPEKFAFIQPILDSLIAKPGRKLAELQMALTVDLKPTDWFAKDVWVRGIADLLILDDDSLTAYVVDYKTGSNKYPDEDQLVLMSLMVFAHHPHIRRVNSALLFVVKDDMRKKTLSMDEAEYHWWKYRERTAKLEAAYESGVWNPNQSGLCRRHCPVVSCEHNGRH